MSPLVPFETSQADTFPSREELALIHLEEVEDDSDSTAEREESEEYDRERSAKWQRDLETLEYELRGWTIIRFGDDESDECIGAVVWDSGSTNLRRRQRLECFLTARTICSEYYEVGYTGYITVLYRVHDLPALYIFTQSDPALVILSSAIAVIRNQFPEWKPASIQANIFLHSQYVKALPETHIYHAPSDNQRLLAHDCDKTRPKIRQLLLRAFFTATTEAAFTAFIRAAIERTNDIDGRNKLEGLLGSSNRALWKRMHSCTFLQCWAEAPSFRKELEVERDDEELSDFEMDRTYMLVWKIKQLVQADERRAQKDQQEAKDELVPLSLFPRFLWKVIQKQEALAEQSIIKHGTAGAPVAISFDKVTCPCLFSRGYLLPCQHLLTHHYVGHIKLDWESISGSFEGATEELNWNWYDTREAGDGKFPVLPKYGL
ncbi:hypothetical protein BJ508DRAFT_331633 [Ascobolus immersus RN42]|uniref:SWIM-type domain-containing protein n=1 Tax=Ascobolus immersus RN42 TaxID=1160509 RepID=A0A3N4HTU6_ASCIM|nr:hypothetical protein BJ508DRAFT_331633 [Ascobolus immersus RN42]